MCLFEKKIRNIPQRIMNSITNEKNIAPLQTQQDKAAH